MDVGTMQSALLGWAPQGWRDLPWRRLRDPWAVLVSEVMLQQTQVARVVPAWEAFLERWPAPADAAAAAAADVVRAWAGLGYNRRALNLHRAAVRMTERHDGHVPDDLQALLDLPGVGPYTARAVLVFAFGRHAGVLDTNALRVLCRAIAGRRMSQAEAQRLADEVAAPAQAWAWNQALLDLGATVCTARRPQCGRCPLVGSCAWRRTGGADPAAPVLRPSRFDGSDRQGRGRLISALRVGPVPAAHLGEACGWPDDAGRARRIADRLIGEGFAALGDAGLHLS